ncbi:MAG TPA: hypothetical protein VHU42_02865 [Rhodopila sp.]|jgi:hypothetical protein|nr:hypothetical protein [Rhodopila sp.]
MKQTVPQPMFAVDGHDQPDAFSSFDWGARAGIEFALSTRK